MSSMNVDHNSENPKEGRSAMAAAVMTMKDPIEGVPQSRVEELDELRGSALIDAKRNVMFCKSAAAVVQYKDIVMSKKGSDSFSSVHSTKWSFALAIETKRAKVSRPRCDRFE